MGYVKQIPRCLEKSTNARNCTRIMILQSRRDRRTDPKTFRNCIGSRDLFSAAVVTSRSEYFTVKRITEKLICCLSCMVFKRRLITGLSQKFPNSTSRAIRSKRLRQNRRTELLFLRQFQIQSRIWCTVQFGGP